MLGCGVAGDAAATTMRGIRLQIRANRRGTTSYVGRIADASAGLTGFERRARRIAGAAVVVVLGKIRADGRGLRARNTRTAHAAGSTRATRTSDGAERRGGVTHADPLGARGPGLACFAAGAAVLVVGFQIRASACATERAARCADAGGSGAHARCIAGGAAGAAVGGIRLQIGALGAALDRWIFALRPTGAIGADLCGVASGRRGRVAGAAVERIGLKIDALGAAIGVGRFRGIANTLTIGAHAIRRTEIPARPTVTQIGAQVRADPVAHGVRIGWARAGASNALARISRALLAAVPTMQRVGLGVDAARATATEACITSNAAGTAGDSATIGAVSSQRRENAGEPPARARIAA